MKKFLFTLIAKAVMLASPGILEDLRNGVQAMVKKAETTPNPWDDIIVGMIQMLIGKPGEEKQEVENE